MKTNHFYSFHPIAQTFGNLVDEFVNKGLLDLAGGQIFQVNSPAINVMENDKEYIVQVAAPGLDKSAFKLAIEKNQLVISAEVKETNEESTEKYTRKEFNFKSFSRQFTLPENADVDQINASYEHGILSVKVAKFIPTQKESKVIEIL